MTKKSLLACVLVAALAAVPALGADPVAAGEGQGQGKGQGKGHGKGHGEEQGKRQGDGQDGGNSAGAHGKAHADKKSPGKDDAGDRHRQARFADDQRRAIQRYYRDEYSRSGDCPPGLAKKNNGCLPPGQTKKRWETGRALPGDVAVVPLPPALRRTLPPPMPGQDYGYIDGDVVLFSGGSSAGSPAPRIVLDLVPAF